MQVQGCCQQRKAFLTDEPKGALVVAVESSKLRALGDLGGTLHRDAATGNSIGSYLVRTSGRCSR